MSTTDKSATKAMRAGTKWDKAQSGKMLPTFKNCCLYLEEAGVKLAYNQFGSFIELNGQRYEDHDSLKLKEAMVARGFEPSVKTIDEAVITVGLRNSYHPVKQYLEALVWDGHPRVEDFLRDYAGAPDDVYTKLVSTWLLLAPVYRVYSPGCQYDTMVILEGDQGIGKSKLVRALGGPWYKAISLMDRDHNTIQLMQGSWIIEVPELSVFAKRDIESLKAFISNPVDFTRFAFGRLDRSYPRQSVFVGTINPESNGYLMDPTGNRRFLPVKLGDIKVNDICESRDQIFAEALVLFRKGVPVYVSDAEMAKIVGQKQSEREFHDDWSTIIFNHVNRNRLDTGMLMTACDIYERVLKGDIKTYDQRIARRIANILRRMGCGEPKHTKVNGVQGKYFDVSCLLNEPVHTGDLGWEP